MAHPQEEEQPTETTVTFMADLVLICQTLKTD